MVKKGILTATSCLLVLTVVETAKAYNGLPSGVEHFGILQWVGSIGTIFGFGVMTGAYFESEVPSI